MTKDAPLIAHVIYRLDIGGLENGIVNLINSTPRELYRHVVICLAGYTEFANRIRRDDVSVFDLEKPPGKHPGYYLRLYKLLRKLRPDVVHTRNIGTLDCQFVALAAGVRHRIHGEHGWEASDLRGRNRKHVLLRRLSRLVVGRYMAVSRDGSDWLQNVIGIPEERITQIYNGTDTDSFTAVRERRESNSFVIGTVGRLDPIKDQLTLLSAFALLRDRSSEGGQALSLVIVGAGEMRQQLEDFVLRHGLKSSVTLAGSSDDVAAMMRTFDVFVLPSLNEGISNTILEAMASGLPVLATNAGGNPELVVDGVTGSLFAPGDSEGLAELIRMSIENPEARLQQGAEGRSRAVGEFSMAAMKERYMDMYDSELRRSMLGGR